MARSDRCEAVDHELIAAIRNVEGQPPAGDDSQAVFGLDGQAQRLDPKQDCRQLSLMSFRTK